MDLNNLGQLHIGTDEPIETIEPDIGASWDAQAWDDIFNTVNDDTTVNDDSLTTDSTSRYDI